MFIEKISDANKKAYIQKIIDQENVDVNEQDNLFLRPVTVNEWERKTMSKPAYQRKIADLKKRNIYFEIYENFAEDVFTRYQHQYAYIVAFDDTAVKTFKAEVNNRNYSRGKFHLTNTFDFIDQHQAQIERKNPLATDAAYVKEFMLPNLQKIDAEQGTHLVADYKAAIANQFAKKRHLVLEKLQKQQDDLLGLGK